MSLRTKLVLVLIGLVVVFSAVMTLYFVNEQVDATLRHYREEAQSTGHAVGMSLADALLTGSDPDPDSVLNSRVWQESTERILFLKAYGAEGHPVTFGDSSLIASDKSGSSFERNAITAITPRQVRSLLRSRRTIMIRWDRSRDFLDVLVPIRYHGTEMGVIRLGIDTLPLVQQKQSIYYSSFLLTIISCLIVILIGFVATRSVIQPLEELVETVRRFGEGDLEIRSRIETNDEIETLSRQFNDMARGIKERIEERERSLQQLEAVQKAGTRISRTRGSDVFFEVLDEVLQTLYELDTVRVFLWDGAVFQLVHSRPDHDGPLYLDYGDPPVDMLEKVSEPTPISPDENWPDALQVTNWVIPLSVGEELNGALYLELSENLDEREQAWMNIWQTQIAHAVRAMVQEQKLESFYGDPLELERAILDRAMDEGYDTFGLISIPDLSKHVEQEGILYRETLIDDFRRVLENEGWSCDISPLGFDTILVPCRNLNDFDRTSLENQLREACDLDVDIRWLKGDAESVDAVLFSVKSL